MVSDNRVTAITMMVIVAMVLGSAPFLGEAIVMFWLGVLAILVLGGHLVALFFS